MRILVYEYITGGGLWGPQPHEPPGGSLLAEGNAMVRALAEDFAAIPGVEVITLRDARLGSFDLPGVAGLPIHSAEEELHMLRQVAAQTDATLLIAPEWNNELASRARLVLKAGGRLLSPAPEFIELAADKHATAKHLRSHGVPAPNGILLESGEPLPADFPFPAVLKPRDGCGSQDVRLISSRSAYQAIVQTERPGANTLWRLEPFCPGQPVSIAALTGPAGSYLLPACSQRLSEDGQFSYLGGQTPLSAEFDRRTRRLAEKALEALPPAVGYVGFDLILGNDPAGSQDMLIEVNPRLTTSYVGLRALSRRNLAAAMLAAAMGNPVELSFAAGPVEFHANGEVA